MWRFKQMSAAVARRTTEAVTDADADAFIAAAGITDTTQKSAIQTLVVDLKAASLWSKLIAIYPIVGGTASTHKWNLKDPRDLDAAFRIVWEGSITHSATGAKGNGGAGNTFVLPQDLALNSASLWYYSTENITGTGDIEMGLNSGGNTYLHMALDYNGSSGYSGVNSSESAITRVTPSNVFMGVNRIVSNEFKAFVNGSVHQTVSTASGALNTTGQNITILSGRWADGVLTSLAAPSPRECAFAAIGDGLTDTEAADLHTAVTTYQTTLGRENP